MSKAERNVRIIAALREHGSMAQAARDTGVAAATVKRLIKANEEASLAFVEGLTTRIRARLLKHEAKATEASERVAAAHARTAVLRNKITSELIDLDHLALRELDKELEELSHQEHALASKERATRKAQKRAEARANIIYGVTLESSEEQEPQEPG